MTYSRPATEGVLAEVQLEDGVLIGAAELPVAVRHRELIEVGEQGQRMTVEAGEGRRRHDGVKYTPSVGKSMRAHSGGVIPSPCSW